MRKPWLSVCRHAVCSSLVCLCVSEGHGSSILACNEVLPERGLCRLMTVTGGMQFLANQASMIGK